MFCCVCLAVELVSSTGSRANQFEENHLGSRSGLPGSLPHPLADGLQGTLTNQLDLYLIHWPMAYKVHLPFTWISISSTGRWLTRYTYQSVGSLSHPLMAYKVHLPFTWISISSTGQWHTRYTYHSLGSLSHPLADGLQGTYHSVGSLSDPLADGLQGTLTNQLDLYLIHWPMAYKVHLPISWISIWSTGRWLTRYTYQSVGFLSDPLADGLQGILTNQLDLHLIHWPMAYNIHLPISWISTSYTGRWLTRYTYQSVGFLSDPLAGGLQGTLTNQLDLHLIHWPMAYNIHLPISWISISSTNWWLTRYTYQSVGSLSHPLADGLQGILTNQLDLCLIHWLMAYKVLTNQLDLYLIH